MKRASQLLAQFQEVKILHVRRVANPKADALVSLAASLSIPRGEERRITISGRRLLIPLFELSPESAPEEVFGIEITTEQLKDWQTPFLDFSERGCLPDNPTERIEIRKRSTKFIVLKACYIDAIWMAYSSNTSLTPKSEKL